MDWNSDVTWIPSLNLCTQEGWYSISGVLLFHLGFRKSTYGHTNLECIQSLGLKSNAIGPLWCVP